MADTLHIKDASTTIDFDDPDSPYSLKWGGWAPKVARIIHDGMGNRPVYEDLDEELVITIKGATSAAVMANVETLVSLIEQAQLWSDEKQEKGDPPVELEYAVSDSTLPNPGKCYILGQPSSGPIITHPNHFDALKDGLLLSPVKLRFKRQGFWRGYNPSKSDAAVAQNVIASVTWDNRFGVPCPLYLTLGGMDESAAPMQNCALLLVDATPAANLEYQDGTAGTKISSGNVYATQSDIGNDARGGSVGRITASSQVTTQIRYTLTNAIDQNLIGIYAVVRVLNSSREWTAYVHSETERGHVNGASRPKVVLDGADSTQPQVIFLGYLFAPTKDESHKDIFVNLEVDSISGSPTFDIDCIVAIGLDKPYSRTLTLLPTPETTRLDYLYFAPYNDDNPRPFAYGHSSTPDVYYLDWRGDMWLCDTGNKTSGMILATRGSAWVWTNSADVPFAFDWDFTRIRTYLTPQ